MSRTATLIKYLFLAFVIQAGVIAITAAAKNRPATSRGYPDRVRPGVALNLKDANVRHQQVKSLEKKARQAKEASWGKARKHGWKIKGTVQGKSYELMAMENGRPIYYITCNADAAISTGANLLHGAPYSLDGSGLTVGIWDAGEVLGTHQEFDNRVTIIDSSGLDDHSTHVGGTIGAKGFVPAAKGMAPDVNIDSYDWDLDTAEMTSRAASYPNEPGKIYLSNHSYAIMTGWDGDYWYGVWGEPEDRNFGRYGSYAADWDELCYDYPYYLPFKAASNDRTDNAPLWSETFYYLDPGTGDWVSEIYDPNTDPPDDGWPDGFDTIPFVGTAKNIMTVGAVDDAVLAGRCYRNNATMTDFSSWGPADDGRIKPDIVANGVELLSPIATGDNRYGWASGTSMSSPSAAGSAALLMQYYAEFFPGEAMRSSTLKALIIHTATDLGNIGPDYKYGWGLMNAKLAADVIADSTGDPNVMIIEGTLADGEFDTNDFTADANTMIRATLCWTDPPAAPIDELDNHTPCLINDLDLCIIDPCLIIREPYVLDPNDPNADAMPGDNVLDNVEQVYFEAPTSGTYTVEIDHKGTLISGAQDYSLILTLVSSEPEPTNYIYVDDDGPGDFVPHVPDKSKGGPNSDPDEDGSFDHPYDSIQKAIGDPRADDGDAFIIVINGIYTGIGNYDVDPKGYEITIMSEMGRENCIIDCQSNGRAFIFQNGETATTVLEGFTIINGYAEDTNPFYDPNNDPNGFGGAIYCTGSSPTISDCVITDNEAYYGGGGIFCDANSSPLITGCDISYNYCGSSRYDENQVQLGGGIYCRNGSLTVDDCTISYNQAEGWWIKGDGGGIACENSDAMIMYSEVYENDCWGHYGDPYDSDSNDPEHQHGGGIYCDGGSAIIWNCVVKWNDAKWSGGGIAVLNCDAWIIDCEITDNDCWASGAGIYSQGTPDPNISNCYIQNCLIAQNWGSWNGGVSSSYGSFAVVENCTIADNKVDWEFDVGGLECYYGDAFVVNSIIWGNTRRQIYGIRDVNDANLAVVIYSDIQALDVNGIPDPNLCWPGEGNINADPLFANPVHRDYHLQTEYPDGRWNPETDDFYFPSDPNHTDPNTSPCINAGVPDGHPFYGLFSDYSNEPMENGGRINMGAYGNTWQASKSGIVRAVPAEIGGVEGPGGIVNFVDFAVLANNWRLEGAAIIDQEADLDNNGVVDMDDLVIFCSFWLWVW